MGLHNAAKSTAKKVEKLEREHLNATVRVNLLYFLKVCWSVSFLLCCAAFICVSVFVSFSLCVYVCVCVYGCVWLCMAVCVYFFFFIS